jgi:ATP-dependent Clp protease ATP-binding subunit ClpA
VPHTSSVYPFERFTEEAKKVLTLAQEEAERGHHSYIGTEHLLLGILRNGDGSGALALASLHVRIEAVRDVIESVLGRNEQVVFQQIIPTSRVKKVIEFAFEESRRQGHGYVDSGHLLVALMLEGEGIAAHVLQDLGVTIDRVKEALRKVPRERHTPVYTPRRVRAAYEPEEASTETLLKILHAPDLAGLLQAKGLDVDALVQKLSDPPDPVVRLRRYIADLRAELKAMADAGNFEKAANLQKGEKDLLARLAAAEREWIEGL